MGTPEKPKPEDSFFMDLKTSTNLAYILADIHSLCLIPFLRVGTGTRYLGLRGFLAFGLQWLYGGLNNAPEMMAFSCLWLAFAIYRRATAVRRESTDFQGYPFLTAWMFKDDMTALLAEALLMLPLGAALSRVSEPLGMFVSFGAVSLGVKYAFTVAIRSREIDAFGDGINAMEDKARQIHKARRGR